jgi:DNA polymerase I-like protein with 3'-5' exonuclease and polymerase domains
MHALTDDFDLKITKVQGRILESPFLPGVRIIPVLHPAAVLRAPGDYKLFYSAMAYAASIYRGGEELDAGETEWYPVEFEENVQKALTILEENKIVYCSADIETTGLNPRQDNILVLGVGFAKNKVLVFAPDLIPQELFEDSRIRWIYHTGMFDTGFLQHNGLPAEVHHDIRALSYCLNEQSGIHSLEQLSTRLLGAKPYKYKVREKIGKKGFGALSKKDLYERVATDADYTLQIFRKLHSQVCDNPDLNKLYHKLLIPAINFLRRVSNNGIYVYRPLLEEYKEEYQDNLDNIQNEILDIAQPLWNPSAYMRDTGKKTAPEIFNPGSTYQVAWLLFDRLGLKPKNRRKGRSTDKEVLEGLQGQHPLIDMMLEHRSVAKELSTYIIGVEKHIEDDGRVHSVFSPYTAVTGRLASSEPNVQNQPKRKPKVRNIFQAPPEKILVELDYKGAELRVLAHMSKDPGLVDCFVQGRDLHTEVEQALNIPRIRAKAVNFGIAYGRTEYSIAEEFEISVYEARRYIDMWFRRFPVAKEYLDRCARAPAEGRPLINPFGRHRRFGLVTPENLRNAK